MSEYGVARYGYDSPSRVAGTSMMLAESTALLPGEPRYAPIPFPPSPFIASGASAGSSASGDTQVWSNYPSRCDLTWYQGDDVMIPLYFDNPADLDMSDQDGYEWHAEVRVLHSYRSTLVNTFSIDSTAIPPDTEAGTPGVTRVSMFLPRSENIYTGKFRWDLYSLSPIEGDMSEYPPLPDAPTPWPPTTTLRTWLYGVVMIYPRVTGTDFLPASDTGSGSGGDTTTVVMPFFVGPNGRVP